ncbi:hypothetical protein BJ165DRAFT_1532336 [Panaeolus papilionaceus]|nr:hypothetical protein BJ165DRAFT_1532336 [Panaeolus papilionaceus]
MLHLDNFSAWITVEGREVEEYAIEYSDDGLCASCYIASEAGKSFAIWWRDTVRPSDSMGRTFVDGRRCGLAKGINKKGYRRNPIHERDTACINGVATSSTQAQELIFSDLSLTDEEASIDFTSEPQLESDLGLIKLEVSYVRRGGHEPLKVIPFEPYHKVDERSRKGLPTQHQTRLGDPVTKQFNPMFAVKAIGAPRVFLFKYRPSHVLHMMAVIPKSLPAPVIDLSMDLKGEIEPTENTDNTEQEPTNEQSSPDCAQPDSDATADTTRDGACEFEETTIIVDEKGPNNSCEFLLEAESAENKDQVKKEIGDYKAFPQLKVEPEETKIKIKTEPGVNIEIKTEDGSFLRVKKDEEMEVHNFLLTKAETE